MDNHLETARSAINNIDKEMAELFVKRMQAVAEVAAYKQQHGMPVLDATREQQVIDRNMALVEDEELRSFYTLFLQNTMSLSRRYQQRLLQGLRIAYSGAKGAFAFLAAEKLFPDGEKVACPDFKSAYDAVVNGDCDSAVLPLENSFSGEVGQVTDLLFSGSLYMNGTVELEVSQDLLGVPGARMEDVTTVLSHPQALSQCKTFIRAHGWQEIECENTALAAKEVIRRGDKQVAAIASEDSASLYGLSVLARSINESRSNTTRFAVLSRSENRSLASQPGAHFALMFTVRNEAGSLARALNIIGAHGFNMRTLRSRPMKELLWQYYFYVEAEGDIHSYEGQCMMEELAICCDRLKAVGSFV